ncbi:tyrosine-protein kinase TXK-like isoform X1 [Clavelina lepadiformis]|uniref:tyrosine-protein kinase TXK-like isoform X1 n=1 Tax=Clavelina lepadiformis TaxID=159417 RepID=UPI00404370E1
MIEEEIKIGMMTKRAQRKKSIGPVNYKERLFVLTNKKLSYYDGTKEQRGKIKESFALNTISSVAPILDEALNRTSAFQIAHDDCYLYCCAKNAEDRDLWMKAITQACQMLGHTLQTACHPNIYDKGKWQCCLNSNKNASGCERLRNKFIDRLPAPNQNRLPEIPRPQAKPVTPRRTSVDFSGSSTGAGPNLPLPPKPGTSANKFATLPNRMNPPGIAEAVSKWPASRMNPVSQSNPHFNPAKVQQHGSRTQLSNNYPQHTPNRELQSGYSSKSPSMGPILENSQFTHRNFSAPRLSEGGSVFPYSEQDMFTSINNHQTKVPYYPGANNTSAQIPVAKYEFTSPDFQARPVHEEQKSVVIALYDFKPMEAEDIALKNGERYTLLESHKPHWWKVRDKYNKEGYVPANYLKDESSNNLETKDWFQKDISRIRAEYILKEDGREGTFVIRNSSQAGIYTLSVVSKGGNVNGTPMVKHYHIKENDEGKYYLSESHPLPSIIELIQYHKHNAGGLVSRLRQPPLCLQNQPMTHSFSNGKWSVDWSEITKKEELGSGQFGVVHRGLFRGTRQVALKIMKEGTMEEEKFIEEAEVMTRLIHKNLVELIGVVINERPICIVTEFMEEGCLLDYIRKNLALQNYPDTLLDMCFQVCDAMKYLEQNQLIHRDLAARNCLVGKNRQIKVADFGLTRFVLDDEYTSSLGSKFPIKWAAPEVLNYTMFSSKSDVWAFGVLMWELFTGGLMPYRALSNTDVVDQVARGYKLERPNNCPHEVYRVMKQCWEMETEKRPSFEELLNILNDLIDEINASSQPQGFYYAR